jgi:hypothetical protein
VRCAERRDVAHFVCAAYAAAAPPRSTCAGSNSFASLSGLLEIANRSADTAGGVPDLPRSGRRFLGYIPLPPPPPSLSPLS